MAIVLVMQALRDGAYSASSGCGEFSARQKTAAFR
jgi:hypothetical protein